MSEKSRRSAWGWTRLGVLVFLLLVAIIFGFREYRFQNRGFRRVQNVVVLIATRPGEEIAATVLEEFRAVKPKVEQTLSEEIAFHGGPSARGVEFFVVPPVLLDAPVPTPKDDSLLELVVYNWKLDRYVQKLVERSGFHSRFETVLLLVATPGNSLSQSIEGTSQMRGHYGIIDAELTKDSVDFAWFVTVHEYLHTRGATDKYIGSSGATFPSGFADREQSPLYPQTHIELMARGRPLGEGTSAPPGSPETWRIGPETAKEIGLRK